MRIRALWLSATLLACATAHAQDEGGDETEPPDQGGEAWEPGQRGVDDGVPDSDTDGDGLGYEPGQRGVDDEVPEPPGSPGPDPYMADEQVEPRDAPDDDEADYAEDDAEPTSASYEAVNFELGGPRLLIGIHAGIGWFHLDPALVPGVSNNQRIGVHYGVSLGFAWRHLRAVAIVDAGHYGWLSINAGARVGAAFRVGPRLQMGLDLEGGFAGLPSLGIEDASARGFFVGGQGWMSYRIGQRLLLGTEIGLRFARLTSSAADLPCDPGPCSDPSDNGGNGFLVRVGLRLELTFP